MDVTSPDCCTELSVRTKCKDCKKIYFRDKVRNQRERDKEKVIKTRSVICKKRSLYYDILCMDCKDKTYKDFCSECVTKYHTESNKKSCSIKKQKILNEFDLVKQKQTDQPNTIQQIRPDCGGINANVTVSLSNEIAVSYGGRKKSKYADLLCSACQKKLIRNFVMIVGKYIPVLRVIKLIVQKN